MKLILPLLASAIFIVSAPIVLGQGPANPPESDCGNDACPGPCDEDGDDGSNAGEEDGDCPPCKEGEEEGTNPVNPYMGNLYRKVSDIRTYGEAPIQFARFFNSRTTTFNAPYWDFGAAQTWQHSWNYEVRQLTTKTFGFFDIKVRYPNGKEENFKATDATGQQLAPSAQWGDRLYRWAGSTVGYTLVTPKGMQYDFWRFLSPRFKLMEVRNGTGFSWTITHDANHKIKRITNNFGKWLEITRSVVNGVECITKVSTSDGREVNYSYSTWTPTSVNVLTSITYPGTETAAYTWTGAQTPTTGRPLLATASDPLYDGAGALTKYVWNYNQIFDFGAGPYLVTGTVLEERNLVTDKTIVSFPSGTGINPVILEGNGTQVGSRFDYGKLVQSWDGEGRSTTYTRDAGGWGRVASSTLPNGATTIYTRDYAGRVLTETDTYSHTESWVYNTDGYLISHTDKLGRVTVTTRDGFNRPVRNDYPDGSYEEWTYNSFGQPLTHRSRMGGVETLTYGADGNVASRLDVQGNTWIYTYNAAGQLMTVTDPRNLTTSYEVNWRGLITKTIHPDSTFTQSGYDAFGNQIAVTNELGHTWTYTYNEYQRKISETDPLNRTTTYQYGREADCGGCSTSQFASTISLITLPSGKTIEYEYDLSWKRTAMVVAPGTADEAVTLYTYNAAGELASTTDPLGNASILVWDLLQRKVSVTDSLGNATSWTYDFVGNTLTETDALSRVTTHTYDTMNRRLTTTDPKNQTTTYTYHPDGNLASLTDARSNTYTFDVDLFGRRTRFTYPDTSFEAWAFNDTASAGSVWTTYTARDGSTMSCTYDNRTRETQCAYSDPATPDVAYTYDVASRMVSATTSVASHSYAYDVANQLLSETTTIGVLDPQSVTYTYDLDGNRATLAYPGGTAMAFDYTARNQLASITADGPPPIATFTYDVNGNRSTKTLENGTTAVYDYDNASRLTAITHSNTGGAFQTVSYTLNAVGNRTARTQNAATDSYTFDPTDQITDVSYAGGPSASYSYDAVGNRTSVTGAVPGAGSYSANNLNEYSSALGQTFSHDTRGNLTGAGTLGTFTYDSKNRLLTASSGANTMTVAYDYRNRPVSRTINGTMTYLIHDGWNLIEELDGTGTLQVVYIHGPMIDEILAKTDTSGSVYYHHDGLGSTIALTDDTGDPVENYTYDVFGAVTILDPSTLASRPSTACGNRFLFTGREWLAEVALYDYRNRIYHSELGRFLQTDPIRFDAGDVNLYRYVANNPVNWGDPTGTHCNDCDKELKECKSNAADQMQAKVRKLEKWDSQKRWEIQRNKMEVKQQCLKESIIPDLCLMGAELGAQYANRYRNIVFLTSMAGIVAEYSAEIVVCVGEFVACKASYGYKENGCPCDE